MQQACLHELKPSAYTHSLLLTAAMWTGSAFAATPAGQAEEGSLQVINPAFAAGNPTPVANYFPDDAAGNAALCRYLALTAAMPQEAVTDEQVLSCFVCLLLANHQPM